ncbi:hypothetical protein FOA52_007813 [Chlamydomonas sp. UWO 241]|nr:hypothetical protein FOA52_007813 [Chlamydomonas sp. UWO 241]
MQLSQPAPSLMVVVELQHGSGSNGYHNGRPHGHAPMQHARRHEGAIWSPPVTHDELATLRHELDTLVVHELFDSFLGSGEQERPAGASPSAAAAVARTPQRLPIILGVEPVAVPMSQPGRPAEPVLLTLRLTALPPPSAVVNVCTASGSVSSPAQTLPLTAMLGSGDGTTLVDVWFTPSCTPGLMDIELADGERGPLGAPVVLLVTRSANEADEIINMGRRSQPARAARMVAIKRRGAGRVGGPHEHVQLLHLPVYVPDPFLMDFGRWASLTSALSSAAAVAAAAPRASPGPGSASEDGSASGGDGVLAGALLLQFCLAVPLPACAAAVADGLVDACGVPARVLLHEPPGRWAAHAAAVAADPAAVPPPGTEDPSVTHAAGGGHTLLHQAVMSGSPAMVRMLIAWAARRAVALDWGVAGPDNVTPVHIARARYGAGELLGLVSPAAPAAAPTALVARGGGGAAARVTGCWDVGVRGHTPPSRTELRAAAAALCLYVLAVVVGSVFGDLLALGAAVMLLTPVALIVLTVWGAGRASARTLSPPTFWCWSNIMFGVAMFVRGCFSGGPDPGNRGLHMLPYVLILAARAQPAVTAALLAHLPACMRRADECMLRRMYVLFFYTILAARLQPQLPGPCAISQLGFDAVLSAMYDMLEPVQLPRPHAWWMRVAASLLFNVPFMLALRCSCVRQLSGGAMALLAFVAPRVATLLACHAAWSLLERVTASGEARRGRKKHA